MTQDEIGWDLLPEDRASTSIHPGFSGSTCTWAALGAWNESSSTTKVPREQKAQGQHSAALSQLSSFRATRSESKGNGKCLMYWPQIHHGFHLRKESVRNISPPTKRKFQPRSLQLSRGATAWLSTTGVTSGAARRIVNLLGKVGRKRGEKTGPRNVHPGVSAYPSLGLCQIKKDQMISASAGVCAC